MTQSNVKLEISELGAAADGIAELDGAPVFVPRTLPGEIVEAQVDGPRAHVTKIDKPSPARTEPECPHFGMCGGCACQHMAIDFYREWKTSLITDALSKHGISAQLQPLFCVPPHDRRRAILTASLARNGPQHTDASGAKTPNAIPLALGFHAAGTHNVVDIKQCLVMRPEIVEALPRLRVFLKLVVTQTRNMRVTVLAANDGLDIALTTVPANARSKGKVGLSREDVTRLAANAPMLNAQRITCDGDPIYARGAPQITCANAQVTPPSGIFVQASQSAEHKMAQLILDALPKRAKNVADLFCGIGAFTFPMASRARVSAYEIERDALGALNSAIRHAQGVKQIKTNVRDLFHEPLSRKELSEFDAVILDPPRAGAKRQAENIAKSKVPVLVYVSCNPATFARDAKTLHAGGYMLQNVTPIDQFVYAAHIELVAVFQKEHG